MSDATLNRIARVIAGTFDASGVEVTEATVAEDVPGWDSLSHTILTLELEEEFGIELGPQSRSFANVGELVLLIDKLLAC